MAFAIFASLSACGANSDEPDSNNTATESSQMKVVKGTDIDKKGADKQMILTGQILYQHMEGGFYGFVANNGDKYLPSGIKPDFLKNGLIVELTVKLMPDVLTTQQFGQVVKVLDIKVLDATKVTDIHENI